MLERGRLVRAEYLMESPNEAARLEAKTSWEDTRRQLELVGLQRGMRVLDAGCGSGVAARAMSEIVGPSGGVTAADFSVRRLDFARRAAQRAGCANVEFVQADLASGPVEEAAFDMVWCRFVFEYLGRPEVVLGHLVRSARIGGKVVAGDLDGNAQFHYPISERLESGMARMLEVLRGRFDPFVGRKLFHLFQSFGLGNVRAHTIPYHVYAGAAPARDMANWEAKFATLQVVGIEAFGDEQSYRSWVDEFLRHLADPNVFTYSTLIIVEGVRLR
jgi:ubiquinone/menaquinone biosynthesis C-methylase UbiE